MSEGIKTNDRSLPLKRAVFLRKQMKLFQLYSEGRRVFLTLGEKRFETDLELKLFICYVVHVKKKSFMFLRLAISSFYQNEV